MLLLGGCSQPSTGSVQTRHQDINAQSRATSDQDGGITYHYYPSAEVYFDPQRETYFWHASAYWGVGRRIPSTYVLDASERQIITLDTTRPYRMHHKVQTRFPGPDADRSIAAVDTNEK